MHTICIDRARSDAVALAWAQEQDEHGLRLDAEARVAKLAEMELGLSHLVGKFRIEGQSWNAWRSRQSGGTADCFGIGQRDLHVSCYRSKRAAGT
jgi:hypothetical protein